MDHGIALEGVGKCHHHRDQQHHYARPLEDHRAEVLKRVMRPEHVEKDLVNNLETQNCINRCG